jgi:hypothetical protein
MDLVRSILSEWESRDFRSVSWAYADIEDTLIGGPEPGDVEGVAEMTATVRDFMSAWQSYGIEAQEYP